MAGYLQGIWRCRYFWLSLVKMDLRTRYRRSVLGIGWSLLNPIAMTAIFCVVFHTVLASEQGIWKYAAFLLSGMACWQYLVTVTLQGCQCFYRGETYIRQYPAPLAIYPLRTVLGAMIHLLLALAVVLLAIWCFKGFGNFPYVVSLAASVVLLFILGWSLAVLAGFATVHFNDTQHLCEIAFQILFYATPVMYPAELLQSNSMGWLVRWNPLLPFLDLVRVPILENRLPAPATFTLAVLAAGVAALAAGLTLTRLERRLIFHL